MAFLRDAQFLREVTALPSLKESIREDVIRAMFLRDERSLPKEVVRVLNRRPHFTLRPHSEAEVRRVVRVLNGQEGTQAFGVLAPGVPIAPEDLHLFRRELEMRWESRLGVGVRPSQWTSFPPLVPLQGGIELDLSELDTVGVDGVTHTAQVQCGAKWKDAYDRIEAQGLYLPLYPVVPLDFRMGDALYGDARLLSYTGDLEDSVHAVRVINAEGMQVTHGFTRVPNQASAYDFRYLMTMMATDLAVPTMVSYRVLPRPKVRTNVAYAFSDADQLGAVLTRFMTSGRPWLRLNVYDGIAWELVHEATGEFVLEVAVGGSERNVESRLQAADALAEGHQGRSEVTSHLDVSPEAYAATAERLTRSLFIGEILTIPKHLSEALTATREVARARGLQSGVFGAATMQGQLSLYPFAHAPPERPRILDLSRAIWEATRKIGPAARFLSPLSLMWEPDPDLATRVDILAKADAILDAPNVMEPPALLEKPSIFFAPE